MAVLIDYQSCSPYRAPDWRFQRVMELDRSYPLMTKPARRDDQHVRNFHTFYIKYQRYDGERKAELEAENIAETWALQLHEHKYVGRNRLSSMVEARILARQSDSEIADELGTIPEAIGVYEAIFFNVRDRFRAHDWILDQVLIPAYEAEYSLIEAAIPDRVIRDADTGEVVTIKKAPRPIGRPFLDATLKFFAYYGGPVCARIAMSCFRQCAEPQTDDDYDAWVEKQFNSVFQTRGLGAAVAFDINRYNVMEVFQVNAALISIARKVQNPTQRRDQIHIAVNAMVANMPLVFGEAGARLVIGTPLAPYDDKAAELRDDEMQDLFSGRKPSTIDKVAAYSLPPGRASGNGEQGKDANGNGNSKDAE